MKLTAAQSEELTFPVRCLVWYNFLPEAPCDDEESSSPILKQGVVESITLDGGTKTLIYEIGYEHAKGNKVVDNDVAEEDVAYAPNCPVTIDAKLEGMVLLPERCSSGKFVYTVMIYMDGCQSRYEFGVDAQRLKYRKIDTTTINDLVNSALTTKNNEPDPPIVVTTAVSESLSKTLTVDTSLAVPASITLADGKRKHEQIDNNESPLTISPRKNQRADTISQRKNERVEIAQFSHYTTRYIDDSPDKRSQGSGGIRVNNSEIIMKVPKWMQRDNQSQSNLFGHLVASRQIKCVEQETNCKIDVSDGQNFPRPITIRIKACNKTNEYGHFYTRIGGPVKPMSCKLSEKQINDLLRERLTYQIAKDLSSANRIWCELKAAGVFVDNHSKEWRADGEPLKGGLQTLPLSDIQCINNGREKVQDLILDYLDSIGDSGAKGRLIYEISSTCDGTHRSNESTSNAVRWRGPRKTVFLSLLELPIDDIGKTFSSHNLLDAIENQRMKRLGCSIKVYGDDSGVPMTLCNPYLLVSGELLKSIDEACVIVRNAIKRKQQQQQSQPLPRSLPKLKLPTSHAKPSHAAISATTTTTIIPPPQLPAVTSKGGRFLKKFETERMCQFKEHNHCWSECPNNPDSKNFNGLHFSEIQANERHEADVCKSLVPVIKLKLPEWIQRDRQSKRELFAYFVYGKAGSKKKRKRCSHDIELESKCQISINGFNKHSEDKASNYAMHIAIRSIRSSKNDVTSAYEKVMDHLREYMKEVDPGAEERLTYEVASSYTGLHCPRESTSNAVASSGSYMSLIELPFVLRKTFHEHLDLLNSEELYKRGCCSIKAFGDNFGVPLKLCAPYCIVTGKSWKNVDEAVVIVKDSIKKHTF